MHTTIATTLLNIIKSREIDRYYEIENDLNLNSLTAMLAEEVQNPDAAMDKIRTALLVLLKKDNVPAQKLIKLFRSCLLWMRLPEPSSTSSTSWVFGVCRRHSW